MNISYEFTPPGARGFWRARRPLVLHAIKQNKYTNTTRTSQPARCRSRPPAISPYVLFCILETPLSMEDRESAQLE